MLKPWEQTHEQRINDLLSGSNSQLAQKRVWKAKFELAVTALLSCNELNRELQDSVAALKAELFTLRSFVQRIAEDTTLDEFYAEETPTIEIDSLLADYQNEAKDLVSEFGK